MIKITSQQNILLLARRIINHNEKNSLMIVNVKKKNIIISLAQ